MKRRSIANLIALVGAALVIVGVSEIYEPLGWIAGGMVLIAVRHEIILLSPMA